MTSGRLSQAPLRRVQGTTACIRIGGILEKSDRTPKGPIRAWTKLYEWLVQFPPLDRIFQIDIVDGDETLEFLLEMLRLQNDVAGAALS
jgi:hypothetical protein